NPAQSGVGSFLKIPWTPLLADPVALTSLTMRVKDLITPKPATWYEELFWGRRYILTLGAGTAGSVAFSSVYAGQRDGVMRLAGAFSSLGATFEAADPLRIEDVSPPTATRRPSRVRAGVENVSLPLTGAEGSMPQALRVQFTYFSGRIAWRPVLISLVLLILGNLMGAFMFTQEVTRFVRRRLHLGSADGRRRGMVPGPEALERLVPAVTTRDGVLAACGAPDEERERRASSGEHITIFRGTRLIPESRLRFGKLQTVRRWDEEQHEVEITLERDRVRNVESRVRRTRQR